MLRITIPPQEFWDPVSETFIYEKEQTLQLEHSLLSLSKWESKWEKAFYVDREKTKEETLDYIRCMTLTKNVDPTLYDRLTTKNIQEIFDYIKAPMTATYFSNDNRIMGRNLDTITAELIYYWMISLNIPFDPCQKWHLNRLFALIRVCNIKNSPNKRMDKSEIIRRHAEINAARRKKYNTKG